MYVTINQDGEEQRDEYPVTGYAGATNNEMELKAPIIALEALRRGTAPIDASGYRMGVDAEVAPV